MTAPEPSHREQIWALLPADAPDAVPWTTRQLWRNTGLEWEIVTATIANMHRAGLIRKKGGTRGLGYMWVRAVESLSDGRGRHGQHARGNDHYQRLARRMAAKGRALRQPANAHVSVPKLADANPLAGWPRITTDPGEE